MGKNAFSGMVSAKLPAVGKNRVGFTAVCALLMFGGSLVGFGDLIGVVYPIFGYCSSVFIVLMAAHYFKLRRTSTEVNINGDKA